MTRQVIHTAAAPESPFYSQGVRAGDHVHVSGMVGVDPATGRLAGPQVADQTRQALANCMAVLAAGGASSNDIVEVGVLLADPADFSDFNEEWARAFPENPPARYVARLGVELPGVRVSIRMSAWVADGAR
jgi:2-iminobutanoate/2-iminopropanoate deaminase